MELRELLTSCNFAIMDIEGIQSTKEHKCIRKISILVKDGYTNITREFIPCLRFRQLEIKYKKAFLYCRKHIHKLPYEPKYQLNNILKFGQKYQFNNILPCCYAVKVVKKFLHDSKVTVVVYKGGSIEREFCADMDIPAYNLEQLGVGKAFNHDPEQEVRFFFNELIRLNVIDI